MSESWSFGAAQSEEIMPPKNVLPENNKRYTDAEAKQPIKFQWTAVVLQNKQSL